MKGAQERIAAMQQRERNSLRIMGVSVVLLGFLGNEYLKWLEHMGERHYNSHWQTGAQ